MVRSLQSFRYNGENLQSSCEAHTAPVADHRISKCQFEAGDIKFLVYNYGANPIHFAAGIEKTQNINHQITTFEKLAGIKRLERGADMHVHVCA